MQFGEQLVALHVGHHDVRDHHVGGAALEGGQRLAPVTADFDFARRVAERLLEQTLVDRIVLNDQNSMHTETPSPSHNRSNFQTAVRLIQNREICFTSGFTWAQMCADVRMTRRRDGFLPPHGQKHDGAALRSTPAAGGWPFVPSNSAVFFGPCWVIDEVQVSLVHAVGKPMRCQNCSAENPEGAKFCSECASPMAAKCPRCGANNKPRAKFCNDCATPLNASAPAAAAVESRQD